MIIHKDEYDILYREKFLVNGKPVKKGEVIIENLYKNKSMKKIKQFQDDYVFELL